MTQGSVKNTTGYVNYVYNISARGTTQVASQLMGLSGVTGSILGQLAFQTSSYLSTTEGALLSMGIVATAGFAKATKQAVEFDQALATIGAISGKTTGEVSGLGEEAMAMSSKFGVAVGEMTEGLESLARAGVSTGNMNAILEQAMGLSKLEGLPLDTAINDLISTTNLLDIEGLDLESPEYAEAVKRQNQRITATSEAAPINAQDIIHTLEHVGGYASSTNLDQEDLFAVIAQLGSKGTKSEMAGTSLRAFLAAGQKDTAQRALKRIGLDVSDLWKNDDTIMSISDMKDVLDEAMEAKGYTKQEKLEFYSDFAGYKQANQIMKIDTTSVREFKEKIDNSWDMSKKIQQVIGTAETNIKGLIQAGTNLLTKVGEPLLPIVSVVAGTTKTIIEIINKIPGSNFVLAGALVLGSIKAISTVFNKIAPQLLAAKGNAFDLRGIFLNLKGDLAESFTILKNINNMDWLKQQSIWNESQRIIDDDKILYWREHTADDVDVKDITDVYFLEKYMNPGRDYTDDYIQWKYNRSLAGRNERHEAQVEPEGATESSNNREQNSKSTKLDEIIYLLRNLEDPEGLYSIGRIIPILQRTTHDILGEIKQIKQSVATFKPSKGKQGGSVFSDSIIKDLKNHTFKVIVTNPPTRIVPVHDVGKAEFAVFKEKWDRFHDFKREPNNVTVNNEMDAYGRRTLSKTGPKIELNLEELAKSPGGVNITYPHELYHAFSHTRRRKYKDFELTNDDRVSLRSTGLDRNGSFTSHNVVKEYEANLAAARVSKKRGEKVPEYVKRRIKVLEEILSKNEVLDVNENFVQSKASYMNASDRNFLANKYGINLSQFKSAKDANKSIRNLLRARGQWEEAMTSLFNTFYSAVDMEDVIFYSDLIAEQYDDLALKIPDVPPKVTPKVQMRNTTIGDPDKHRTPEEIKARKLRRNRKDRDFNREHKGTVNVDKLKQTPMFTKKNDGNLLSGKLSTFELTMDDVNNFMDAFEIDFGFDKTTTEGKRAQLIMEKTFKDHIMANLMTGHINFQGLGEKQIQDKIDKELTKYLDDFRQTKVGDALFKTLPGAKIYTEEDLAKKLDVPKMFDTYGNLNKKLETKRLTKAKEEDFIRTLKTGVNPLENDVMAINTDPNQLTTKDYIGSVSSATQQDFSDALFIKTLDITDFDVDPNDILSDLSPETRKDIIAHKKKEFIKGHPQMMDRFKEIKSKYIAEMAALDEDFKQDIVEVEEARKELNKLQSKRSKEERKLQKEIKIPAHVKGEERQDLIKQKKQTIAEKLKPIDDQISQTKKKINDDIDYWYEQALAVRREKQYNLTPAHMLNTKNQTDLTILGRMFSVSKGLNNQENLGIDYVPAEKEFLAIMQTNDMTAAELRTINKILTSEYDDDDIKFEKLGNNKDEIHTAVTNNLNKVLKANNGKLSDNFYRRLGNAFDENLNKPASSYSNLLNPIGLNYDKLKTKDLQLLAYIADIDISDIPLTTRDKKTGELIDRKKAKSEIGKRIIGTVKNELGFESFRKDSIDLSGLEQYNPLTGQYETLDYLSPVQILQSLHTDKLANYFLNDLSAEAQQQWIKEQGLTNKNPYYAMVEYWGKTDKNKKLLNYNPITGSSSNEKDLERIKELGNIVEVNATGLDYETGRYSPYYHGGQSVTNQPNKEIERVLAFAGQKGWDGFAVHMKKVGDAAFEMVVDEALPYIEKALYEEIMQMPEEYQEEYLDKKTGRVKKSVLFRQIRNLHIPHRRKYQTHQLDSEFNTDDLRTTIWRGAQYMHDNARGNEVTETATEGGGNAYTGKALFIFDPDDEWAPFTGRNRYDINDPAQPYYENGNVMGQKGHFFGQERHKIATMTYDQFISNTLREEDRGAFKKHKTAKITGINAKWKGLDINMMERNEASKGRNFKNAAVFKDSEGNLVVNSLDKNAKFKGFLANEYGDVREGYNEALLHRRNRIYTQGRQKENFAHMALVYGFSRSDIMNQELTKDQQRRIDSMYESQDFVNLENYKDSFDFQQIRGQMALSNKYKNTANGLEKVGNIFHEWISGEEYDRRLRDKLIDTSEGVAGILDVDIDKRTGKNLYKVTDFDSLHYSKDDIKAMVLLQDMKRNKHMQSMYESLDIKADTNPKKFAEQLLKNRTVDMQKYMRAIWIFNPDFATEVQKYAQKEYNKEVKQNTKSTDDVFFTDTYFNDALVQATSKVYGENMLEFLDKNTIDSLKDLEPDEIEEAMDDYIETLEDQGVIASKDIHKGTLDFTTVWNKVREEQQYQFDVGAQMLKEQFDDPNELYSSGVTIGDFFDPRDEKLKDLAYNPEGVQLLGEAIREGDVVFNKEKGIYEPTAQYYEHERMNKLGDLLAAGNNDDFDNQRQISRNINELEKTNQKIRDQQRKAAEQAQEAQDELLNIAAILSGVEQQRKEYKTASSMPGFSPSVSGIPIPTEEEILISNIQPMNIDVEGYHNVQYGHKKTAQDKAQNFYKKLEKTLSNTIYTGIDKIYHKVGYDNSNIAKTFGSLSNKIRGTSEYLSGFTQVLGQASEVFPPLIAAVIALEGVISILTTVTSISGAIGEFLSIEKLIENSTKENPFEFFGRIIKKDSTEAKALISISSILGNVLDKIKVFVMNFLGPLSLVAGAVVATTIALDWSHKSHEKYLKQLQDEEKANKSKSKSLQAINEQNKKAFEKNRNERQDINLYRRYQLSKTKLDNANLIRSSGAIELSSVDNDTLWGKYGIASALDKIQGKYESTAEEFTGTSEQIRKIKEHTTGGQDFIRGLPGYFSPAENQVAAYYDANQLAIGIMDEYKDELGVLYDAETTAMKKMHYEGNPREHKIYKDALDKFVEATGITKEHAEQYLDYMQTEHNVDNATQAMQAQADSIMANTEMKIKAISIGGNPSDILGLNGIEAQQNAMIQAQADLVQLETSSQLWWKAVWATIASPVKLLISPVFAIAHTLAAIWSVITGNWNAADIHMKQAGASLNFWGEAATYWGAWGEVESTNFNQIGQGAVDETDRANYGNASASAGAGPAHIQRPRDNSIFGIFPAGHSSGAHGVKSHKETLAQNAQQSFFSKLIGGITSILGTIANILVVGAAIWGISKIYDHSDWIKTQLHNIGDKYFPGLMDKINKIPGIGYAKSAFDFITGKGDAIANFFGLDRITNIVPQSWKDKYSNAKDTIKEFFGFKDRIDSDSIDEESTEEETVESQKPIEENVSNITTNIQNIWEALKEFLSSENKVSVKNRIPSHKHNATLTEEESALYYHAKDEWLEKSPELANQWQEIHQKVLDTQISPMQDLLMYGLQQVNWYNNPLSTTLGGMNGFGQMGLNADTVQEYPSELIDTYIHELGHQALQHKQRINAGHITKTKDNYDYRASELETRIVTSNFMKELGFAEDPYLKEDIEKAKIEGTWKEVRMDLVNELTEQMIAEKELLMGGLINIVRASDRSSLAGVDTSILATLPLDLSPNIKDTAFLKDRTIDINSSFRIKKELQQQGYNDEEIQQIMIDLGDYDHKKRREENIPYQQTIMNSPAYQEFARKKRSSMTKEDREFLLNEYDIELNDSEKRTAKAQNKAIRNKLDESGQWDEAMVKMYANQKGGYGRTAAGAYVNTQATKVKNIASVWKDFLGNKKDEFVNQYANPWKEYLGTQRDNFLLGFTDKEERTTFNKKKRSSMNKADREYLNEKYNLGLDLDSYRTSKQANKAIRNKLDETGQWDTAMNEMYVKEKGGYKQIFHDRYVDPWKQYAQNKAKNYGKNLWTEAQMYAENPTYLGKNLYDRENASMPVKILGKGLEWKNKVFGKGVGVSSLEELQEAMQDPEKMMELVKKNLDKIDDDSPLAEYRDKIFKAQELAQDPEAAIDYIKNSDYIKNLKVGARAYLDNPTYLGKDLSGEASLSTKIMGKGMAWKDKYLGEDSIQDVLADPERTESIIRGTLEDIDNGALDDLNVMDTIKSKMAGIFNKDDIEEAVDEGIDEGTDGGDGGFFSNMKKKLAGIFGFPEEDDEVVNISKDQVTVEEPTEEEEEEDFVTNAKKKMAGVFSGPDPEDVFVDISKDKYSVKDADEDEYPEDEDTIKVGKNRVTVEEPTQSDEESFTQKAKRKMAGIFDDDEDDDFIDIGKDKYSVKNDKDAESAIYQGKQKLGGLLGTSESGALTTTAHQMESKISSAGAADTSPSILPLDEDESMLPDISGKDISKGGKSLSKIGSKLAGKGGKLGKIGGGLSKIGGGISKAGEKGIGGIAKGGLSKIGKTGVGKAGGKLMNKVGGKIASKVGGKIASKVGAQVASKVLGGALMATGIGAPLGLLLESPIGGMLMEGVFDLGGKALGAVGGAIGSVGKALGFGRSAVGKGGGGLLGAAGGALGAAGGALGAAGGFMKNAVGGVANTLMGAPGAVMGFLGNAFGGKGIANMGGMNKFRQPVEGMKGVLDKIFKNDQTSTKHQEAIEKATQKTAQAMEERKAQSNNNATGGSITIQNININTADDPEAIKAMFLELIIELQEQVNPRLVSRTAGQAPSGSNTTTDSESTDDQSESGSSDSSGSNSSSSGSSSGSQQNN